MSALIKTPSAAEFKRQYLASLKQDISNQTKNYQANQVFKATQQPSQPPDTRSITDKMADKEGMKVLLRAELMKNTDGANAQSIISKLGDDELEFAYRQFGALERELKARFKTGVPAEAFINFLERYIKQFEETGGVAPTLEEALAPIKSELELITRRGNKAVEGATGEYQSNFTDPLPEEDWSNVRANGVKTVWSKMRNELLRQYGSERGLSQAQIDRRQALKLKIDKSGMNSSSDKIRQWCAENPADWEYFRSILGGTQGAGIKGAGVAPRKSRGIAKKDLVPFGRYFIDACKLEGEVIHLKKPCGANVPEIPTRRVSKNVGNILKGIVGGKLPLFEDIEPLANDEREYLHNVVKRAKLNNQVRIPLPKKEEAQAEMDRWELLKGQILAGNDNRELVREFKVLLLKYTKEGRIPRREANEVLTDLLSLGL